MKRLIPILLIVALLSAFCSCGKNSADGTTTFPTEATTKAETERETFDSKQFKADMPELYDEYVKFSKVKPSVRIKVEE